MAPSVNLASPPKKIGDVVEYRSEALRIVSDKVFQGVRDLKAAIAAKTARTSKGTLLSKPEGGFRHLLSGLLRCHECGGALGWQKEQYRCRANSKSAAKCGNNVGIPASAIEYAVKRAVVKVLHTDPAALADVVESRQAAVLAQVETQGDPYADAQVEIAQCEQEIANLVTFAASGKAPAAILTAIVEKESRVETLKAIQPVERFDRGSFLTLLPSVSEKYSGLLLTDGEEIHRAALRRLDCSSLVAVKRPRTANVWDLRGRLDLEKALTEVREEDAASPAPDYSGGPAFDLDGEVISLDSVGSQGERAG